MSTGFGIINKINDLNLHIVSVTYVTYMTKLFCIFMSYVTRLSALVVLIVRIMNILNRCAVNIILWFTFTTSIEFSSVMRLHFMYQKLSMDKIRGYREHVFRDVESDSPKVNVWCVHDK